MKNPKFIRCIIAIQLVIILCMSVVIIINISDHQREKVLFINEAYFLLWDIEDVLSKQETSNIPQSSGLYEDLIRLDAICAIRFQESNQSFYYAPPGIFKQIADRLLEGTYSTDDIQAIAEGLQCIIDKMSNKSGDLSRRENQHLSYDELSEIFKPFYNNFYDYWEK